MSITQVGASTADAHTYDKGYKKWESFDVNQAHKDIEISTTTESNQQQHSELSTTKQPPKVQKAQQNLVVGQQQKSLKDFENEEKERGNGHFRKGQFQEAVRCYTKCLGYNTRNTIAYSNRAMAYLKLKVLLCHYNNSTTFKLIMPMKLLAGLS